MNYRDDICILTCMGRPFWEITTVCIPFFNSFLKNTTKGVLVVCKLALIFVSVFHRILDFKTGLYFYAGPFFMPLL